MIPWLLTAALAAPGAEAPIVETLADEVDAAVALRLDDSPAPYHVRLMMVHVTSDSAEASFGGLVADDVGAGGWLGAEVRVGSPAYDNLGFGGWRSGVASTSLPAVPTPRAVELAAWRLTDLAFKDAVEQYSRKRAQVPEDGDRPADFVVPEPVVVTLPAPASGPSVDAAGLATAVSAGFVAHPTLTLGRVVVGHELGTTWILDSAGTRVRRPVAETSLRMVAHARAEDGLLVSDHRLVTVRPPDALPDAAALAAQAAALGAEVLATASAPRFEGEYVGPVIFEGEAAVSLFRWLLTPQLEGTPADTPFDSFLGDLGGDAGGARILRRVLPSGWRVVEDAEAVGDHPGVRPFDDEGSPVRRVELVTDGIVRTLLTSRTPTRGVDGSTGHAVHQATGRAVARSQFLTVTPARTLPERRLHRVAMRAAAAYELDHVLVVRRLQHPSLHTWREPEVGDALEAGLPAPVAVWRRYADGREERVRGARFVGVDRRVLRDLVAAGPLVHADVLVAGDGAPGRLGPVEGLPGRLTVPEVVVGELEVVAVTGDPAHRPRLPAPKAVGSRR